MAHSLRFAIGGAVLAALLQPAAAATPTPGSRIVGVTVAGAQPVGIYNGVAYARTYGTVDGIVDPHEDVVGLSALPKNADGAYPYTAEFEVIAPAGGQPQNEVAYIDSENRGGPVMMGLANEAGGNGPPSRIRYPGGLGNGFFQRHAITYARVQWQTKISKDVPETAQGVGLVIVRDFARLLSGYTAHIVAENFNPGTYSKLILGGKSQSAWFVNDFIAEGFNVEPITHKGVFQGAIAVDGIGHWMALNNLAAQHHVAQAPYMAADEKPLNHSRLLSRPVSDPVFVDVAAYTDFYRLRASLSDDASPSSHYRRYDIPGPHQPQKPPVRAEAFMGCNNGEPVPLNPTAMSPYVRAEIVELEKVIGVKAAQSAPSLPPSTLFKLGPVPKGITNFNPLPGARLEVPLVDANAWPEGGVRFPDADYPLGRPVPVSLAPVITTSIDTTCGNRGVFQPFAPDELAAKYGSRENYLALYDKGVKKMIGQGFALAEDEQPMLDYAGYLWDHAGNYLQPRATTAN